MASTLCQNWFEKQTNKQTGSFVKRLDILHNLYKTNWFKFHQHVVPSAYQIMYGDTVDLQCQNRIYNGSTEEF